MQLNDTIVYEYSESWTAGTTRVTTEVDCPETRVVEK